jgi:hypothetical protein
MMFLSTAIVLFFIALLVTAKKGYHKPACDACHSQGERLCGMAQGGDKVIVECVNSCWTLV